MKTNILYIFLLICITFSSTGLFGQSRTMKTDIKVYGNCGMCKERIEAALDQPGIKVATWNTKTKNLEVVYNSKKISEQRIHELVAGAGHDTDKARAKDEVYAKLPFCCLYRDHDHSGIEDDKPKKHHDH